jgi:3-hydroxyisobutyrate dehydrogenase-like beta-hydroxyacid dehydrogenase
MNLTIGVIGLGNMGSVLAKRLAERFQVLGYDIDDQKMESASDNGVICSRSLEELAARSDFIVLSLPKPEISFSSVRAICPFVRKGTTIIETSTVAPADVVRLSELSASYDIKVIDAALLGGISHAIDGTIGLLVGGGKEEIDRAMGVLHVLSGDIQVLGKLGSGMAAKIINNAVAHSVMVLIVEAAALSAKMGIPPESTYKLLQGDTALQRPLIHRYGERILNEKYDGGMSTSNARKDSSLALHLGQELGVPLFAIQSTHTVYELAVLEGLGNLDYAAIAKLWEKWTTISLAGNAPNV